MPKSVRTIQAAITTRRRRTIRWARRASTSSAYLSEVERLAKNAHGRRRHRAQVERDGAVGDPFEIVCELLRHRRLVAVAHLREAREPRPHDEPLPVRGQLVGELHEEARADRP